MRLINLLSNRFFSKRNIFISYRRNDAETEAGRLADTLKQYFSEDKIFFDTDDIEPGIDYINLISQYLDSCHVMLVVIGPDWVGRKEGGAARIKDPNDWVRLEVSTALKHNIRVIPVLVHDTALPQENELPDELLPLLRREAYAITNSRWKYETDRLANSIERLSKIPLKKAGQNAKTSNKTRRLRYMFYGFLLTIALIIFFSVTLLSDRGSKVPANTYLHNKGVENNFTINNTLWEGNYAYLHILGNRNSLVVKVIGKSTGTEIGSGMGYFDGTTLSLALLYPYPNMQKDSVLYTLSLKDYNGSYALEGNYKSFVYGNVFGHETFYLKPPL